MKQKLTAWLLLSANLAAAEGPPVILDMRIEDRVVYFFDNADPTKLATQVTKTMPDPARTFSQFFSVADIVSINGKPTKGVWTIRAIVTNMSPTPRPGDAIADVVRGNQIDSIWEVLHPDGTAIGTIAALGLSAGPSPPGAPVIAQNTNLAICGGTGAFLGVRGQASLVELIRIEHLASMTEDPSNRRVHSGGNGVRRLVLHLIPMIRPEIMTSGGRAEILHSDFSPVTPSAPARAGEVLLAIATGLGPVRLRIDPGSPFPQDPLAPVSSPVEVLINGEPVEVINAVGFPETTERYRVDFRVPAGTPPGPVSVGLRAAWIAGTTQQFNIR